MSLSPSGHFNSSLTSATSSGQAEFSYLRILSAGAFTITATRSSPGLTAGTLALAAISNFLHSITLSSPASVSAFFALTVSVTVLGEDGEVFTSPCVLSLTGSAFAGSAQATSSAGLASFSIYFLTAGPKALNVASGGISADLAVQVLQCRLLVTAFTAVSFS